MQSSSEFNALERLPRLRHLPRKRQLRCSIESIPRAEDRSPYRCRSIEAGLVLVDSQQSLGSESRLPAWHHYLLYAIKGQFAAIAADDANAATRLYSRC